MCALGQLEGIRIMRIDEKVIPGKEHFFVSGSIEMPFEVFSNYLPFLNEKIEMARLDRPVIHSKVNYSEEELDRHFYETLAYITAIKLQQYRENED